MWGSGRFAQLCVIVLTLGAAQENFCSQPSLSRFDGFPKQLDAAIYWFGPEDQTEKATGSASKFYDPSRPTMLYFHGWTGQGGGWTSKCKRLTTRCHPDICPNGGGQLLVNSWLEEGWNVGFFYWDQFSDEECARDAEQKLWFDRGGDGIRWKSFDPATGRTEYRTYQENLDELSVSDMCANSVKMAMGSFKGSQVRFVGHSLGAQLAVRCASLLHVEDHAAAPQRLALLEPYFSKHSHMYFFGCHAEVTTDEGMGDFAAKLTVQFVQHLWKSKKVVTEVYKSSQLTEETGEESPYSELKNLVENGAVGGVEKALVGNLASGMRAEDLERSGTMVKYNPDWCEGVGSSTMGDVEHVACRHCAVMPMYLLGFGRAPPALRPPPTERSEPGSALSSCMTPSASCTDGQLRQWVQRQLDMAPTRQSWLQIAGRRTFDEVDDAFQLDPSIEQGFQLGLRSANSLVQKTALELPKGQEFSLHALLTTPWMLLSVVGFVFTVVAAAIFVKHCQRWPWQGDDSDDELSQSPNTTRRVSMYSREPEPSPGYDPLLASQMGSSFSSTGSRTVLVQPMPPLLPLPAVAGGQLYRKPL
ncbi:TPR repeat-containing thioredoxin TTL1 [Durusdinium trenchii]|uniref:TPR repeat-containing thioredoxin TTL1 n=1 Tax=Durusdinium trenchii TaxID=1381693 RepID=A0ABP0MND8_9DINO